MKRTSLTALIGVLACALIACSPPPEAQYPQPVAVTTQPQLVQPAPSVAAVPVAYAQPAPVIVQQADHSGDLLTGMVLGHMLTSTAAAPAYAPGYQRAVVNRTTVVNKTVVVNRAAPPAATRVTTSTSIRRR